MVYRRFLLIGVFATGLLLAAIALAADPGSKDDPLDGLPGLRPEHEDHEA